jgi:hypothetical protein
LASKANLAVWVSKLALISKLFVFLDISPAMCVASTFNRANHPRSSWYKTLDGQTSYELTNTTEAWNYRCLQNIQQLREQVEMFACSGGIWTQTTDVEGEVNGMLTYDRRINRMDKALWQKSLAALYAAAEKRGQNATMAAVVDRAVGFGGLQKQIP